MLSEIRQREYAQSLLDSVMSTLQESIEDTSGWPVLLQNKPIRARVEYLLGRAEKEVVSVSESLEVIVTTLTETLGNRR